MQNDGPHDRAPQYPIEAVDKALRLLLLFRERGQLRLTEAYEALDIGKSRAHRLLAMLVFHRFVVQDPASKVYLPGPALVEIGLATVAQMDIRGIARPFLEEIATATGETVHLARLEGGDIRFVDCIESQLTLRVAGRVGRLLPAYATSLGKAILAGLTDEEVCRLYPTESLPAVTQRTIRRRSELLAELDSTRARGYAVNHEESEDGVSSVGVALNRNLRGPTVGLSVAAPTARLSDATVERVAQLLLNTAERLR